MKQHEFISYLNDLGIEKEIIKDYIRLFDEMNYSLIIKRLKFYRKEKLSEIHFQQNQLIMLDDFIQVMKEEE